MTHRIGFALALLLLIPAPLAAQDTPAGPGPGAAYIAGTDPSERPPEAPVIKTFEKSAQWYENALFGVSEPYPESLRFLEDEGAWFTPFNHPGMTHPYDIRGWHEAQ